MPVDPSNLAVLVTEVDRLRNGLRVLAEDIAHLARRIGLQDPGSPWCRELQAIERGVTVLLAPAAAEGEQKP